MKRNLTQLDNLSDIVHGVALAWTERRNTMRMVDADELVLDVMDASNADEALAMIDDAPTIDAVPVVRCRECRYFSITKDNDLHLKVSGCYRLKKLGEEYPLVVQGDGYCSWGQRREEDA